MDGASINPPVRFVLPIDTINPVSPAEVEIVEPFQIEEMKMDWDKNSLYPAKMVQMGYATRSVGQFFGQDEYSVTYDKEDKELKHPHYKPVSTYSHPSRVGFDGQPRSQGRVIRVPGQVSIVIPQEEEAMFDGMTPAEQEVYVIEKQREREAYIQEMETHVPPSIAEKKYLAQKPFDKKTRNPLIETQTKDLFEYAKSIEELAVKAANSCSEADRIGKLTYYQTQFHLQSDRIRHLEKGMANVLGMTRNQWLNHGLYGKDQDSRIVPEKNEFLMASNASTGNLFNPDVTMY
jgi:hypothetical protein